MVCNSPSLSPFAWADAQRFETLEWQWFQRVLSAIFHLFFFLLSLPSLPCRREGRECQRDDTKNTFTGASAVVAEESGRNLI
jgi:hypothetical protein